MVKRTFVTWLTFFLITFGIHMLLSGIGLFEPMTLMEGIIIAFITSIFYFVFLFFQTRRHSNLAMIIFCIVGIFIIFMIVKSGQTTTKELLEIDIEFIVVCIIHICQGITAAIQGIIYKAEEVRRQIQKDEEIDTDE